MTSIRRQSFAITLFTLAAGFLLSAAHVQAADEPLDPQAQAQRVIVAPTGPQRAPVADGTRVLDLQLQANRVMGVAAPFAATHRAATAAVRQDAQESARRLLAGNRAGV